MKRGEADVLEAASLDFRGAHIEAFRMGAVRLAEFGIPMPEGSELLHRESRNLSPSPDPKVRQEIRYAICVVNMPAFIQRLHGYARSARVEVIENARSRTASSPGFSTANPSRRGPVSRSPRAARPPRALGPIKSP